MATMSRGICSVCGRQVSEDVIRLERPAVRMCTIPGTGGKKELRSFGYRYVWWCNFCVEREKRVKEDDLRSV